MPTIKLSCTICIFVASVDCIVCGSTKFGSIKCGSGCAHHLGARARRAPSTLSDRSPFCCVGITVARCSCRLHSAAHARVQGTTCYHRAIALHHPPPPACTKSPNTTHTTETTRIANTSNTAHTANKNQNAKDSNNTTSTANTIAINTFSTTNQYHQ